MATNRELTALKNIGEKIAGRLEAVGIHSEQELRKCGAAAAHRLITNKYPKERLPVCYYLYSFEGALRDVDWRDLDEECKQALKAEIN